MLSSYRSTLWARARQHAYGIRSVVISSNNSSSSGPHCPMQFGSTSIGVCRRRTLSSSTRRRKRTSAETASSSASTLLDADHVLSTIARQTGIGSGVSTVEQGTAYEEHTQAFLRHTFPRMDLMRVGGANDGGVDLTGWWWSPLSSDVNDGEEIERIRVSVQCKSEARKLGPVHVREMRGTMTARHAVHQDRPSTPAMAILASCSGFSKQCLLQAFAAPFPLMLIHLLYPAQQAQAGLDASKFACPAIAANEALLQGLLRDRLEIRYMSTLAHPKPPGSRGRPPAPVKVDLPALFLNGTRL